ncbi:hypothetical protein GCM10010470_41210 [Saccharopolyspora taberi]|uniref:Uncharacterized protein n=1 Tax=Saccharopolyspora taberi TaxID=60895 RepID=A0ABN3VG32_9PSEU
MAAGADFVRSWGGVSGRTPLLAALITLNRIATNITAAMMIRSMSTNRISTGGSGFPALRRANTVVVIAAAPAKPHRGG